MRKGFTLVELSIVLVIIGLLIGGILAAQNLIETAKINNLIRQLGQMDVAVNNFSGKYNSIPGDSPVFVPRGNDDGQIGNYTEDPPYVFNGFAGSASPYPTPVEERVGYSVGAAKFYGEVATFYQHLRTSGFTMKGLDSPEDDATSGIKVGTHIPATAFSNTGIFVTTTTLSYSSNTFINGNTYILADLSSTTGDLTSSSSFHGEIPNEVSIAIDSKADDGVLSTGKTIGLGSETGIRGRRCQETEKCVMFFEMGGLK